MCDIAQVEIIDSEGKLIEALDNIDFLRIFSIRKEVRRSISDTFGIAKDAFFSGSEIIAFEKY